MQNGDSYRGAVEAIGKNNRGQSNTEDCLTMVLMVYFFHLKVTMGELRDLRSYIRLQNMKGRQRNCRKLPWLTSLTLGINGQCTDQSFF